MTDPLRPDEPGLERRFIVALGLSVLILVGWGFLFPTKAPAPTPSAEPVAAAPAPAPNSPADAPTVPPAASSPATEPAAASPVAATGEERIEINTALFDVALTNEGGRVLAWKVKGNGANDGATVNLVPAAARASGRLPLAFDVDDAALSETLNKALFKVERSRAGDVDRVAFSWSDASGLSATKVLEFRPDSPLVDLQVDVVDRGRRVPVRLAWGPGLEADDAVTGGYIHYTGQAVYRVPGALPKRLRRDKVDETLALPAAAGTTWAGLEEQYFAALFLPSVPGDVVIRRADVAPAAEAGTTEAPKAVPQLVAAVGFPDGKGQLFVGAKQFHSLRALGHGLEDVVWFSDYGLIYICAKYLFLALAWIHSNTVANWGVAIILATVLLRVVFFPLNQYSMVKMKKTGLQMQRVQPKMKAIQAKWKKSKDPQSRQKMNEEVMALYKKEGVNPFGGVSGCLPMLIQFPILIAFYNMLTVAVELRGAPFFGWIQDLTQRDPYYITPLLMGATMFIQQKMTPASGMDPAQQRMLLLMPIVFTVMFLNLPSGLVLYWFVNNLLGIGQQWLVNRHVARLQAAAPSQG
ncbi:MAG TPA: membrane protein insertase YidC [Candidatus Polarisedimenticolaceae bacterium]